MHLRRRAVVGVLAMTFLAGACTEYDNGNNTLAERDPSPTAVGNPQTTRPAEGEPSDAPNGQGGPIKLEAKDNAFEPKTIEAKTGDVTIEMKNTGVAPHTFTNADLGVDVNANAGQTANVSLKAVKPGTYKFVCKYHESLGMVGELKVT
ncbi:MAG TPA: cupredoxin domain-containing protein [Frankiaceae bacterium]|jgi:plastocyanin|nr:cupredoxin domain-containing protein [Frankiaceae bacterium]